MEGIGEEKHTVAVKWNTHSANKPRLKKHALEEISHNVIKIFLNWLKLVLLTVWSLFQHVHITANMVFSVEQQQYS